MKFIFSLLFIVFVTIACEKGKANKKVAIKKPIIEKLLPDSSFNSVQESLTYEVKVFDLTGPSMKSLKSKYSAEKGVLAFRGASSRDVVAEGQLKARPSEIKAEWEFDTEYNGKKTNLGVWGGGSGWTGQPLIINWDYAGIPASAKKYKPEANKEVIISSLCGKIYFLNFDDGKKIRPTLDTYNPIKGTAMFDPDFSGNLLVGQGVKANSEFGFRIFNVFDGKLVKYVSGIDRDALRGWGAFDSSPIKVDDYYFWPGENGMLYKFRLIGDKFELHSKLIYRAKSRSASSLGVESSMAVYKNYGYWGDNQGNLICVNLNTLKPIWYFDNVDDSDASIVIEEENGVPFLYVGCEVDKQGNSGFSYLRKINGLNGQSVWLNKVPAHSIDVNEKTFNGGLLSTPLLGKHQAKDLIYFSISQPGKSNAGELLALDKKTGNVKFQTKLHAYSWSSPVGFYTKSGEPFVVIGDVVGNLYLIDGLTGEKMFYKNLGGNFEASPAVMGDQMVLGSRGNKIYKFKIL